MENLNSILILIYNVTISFYLGIYIKKRSTELIKFEISSLITIPICSISILILSVHLMKINIFVNFLIVLVSIILFYNSAVKWFKDDNENYKGIYMMDIKSFFNTYIIVIVFFLVCGLIAISQKMEKNKIQLVEKNAKKKYEKIFKDLFHLEMNNIDTTTFSSESFGLIPHPQISIIKQKNKEFYFDLELNKLLFERDSNYVSRHKDSTNLIVFTRNSFVKVGEYSGNLNTGGGNANRQDRIIYFINPKTSKSFRRYVLEGEEPPSNILVRKFSRLNGATGELKSDEELCFFILSQIDIINGKE